MKRYKSFKFQFYICVAPSYHCDTRCPSTLMVLSHQQIHCWLIQTTAFHKPIVIWQWSKINRFRSSCQHLKWWNHPVNLPTCGHKIPGIYTWHFLIAKQENHLKACTYMVAGGRQYIFIHFPELKNVCYHWNWNAIIYILLRMCLAPLVIY